MFFLLPPGQTTIFKFSQLIEVKGVTDFFLLGNQGSPSITCSWQPKRGGMLKDACCAEVIGSFCKFFGLRGQARFADPLFIEGLRVSHRLTTEILVGRYFIAIDRTRSNN